MFCGRCGVDDDKNVVKKKFVQDGNTIIIYYYGLCTECGEYLGLKEIFKYELSYAPINPFLRVLRNTYKYII